MTRPSVAVVFFAVHQSVLEQQQTCQAAHMTALADQRHIRMPANLLNHHHPSWTAAAQHTPYDPLPD
jgi:hypothetical protein